MMDYVTILTLAVESVGPEAAGEGIVPIDLIWEYITSLNLLEALTFMSFGSVCLIYGWRIFKMLVVISFALLGLIMGITISDKISGGDNQLLGGLIGLGVMAALSVPLVRWAVCILGAVAGGILTSGIWFACGLNERYIWAGAIIGMVAGGMISFIIFKIAVMLFSSVGGSGLMVVGILAVMCNAHVGREELVKDLVLNHNWFLPVALFIPTVVGVILQNKFIKGSRDWSV
ncbi:MAG: hypothetical protein ACYS6W_00525 [Planctomycetota bacterium]|jgi:hypothetical protein